jgi:hypothetical protein
VAWADAPPVIVEARKSGGWLPGVQAAGGCEGGVFRQFTCGKVDSSLIINQLGFISL